MNISAKYHFIVCVFMFYVSLCLGAVQNHPARWQDPQLVSILEAVRKKHDLPGITAAIVTSQGIERIAAVGTRKRGTDIRVTLHDHWHMGSCTKAMTATLISILVEEGKLDLDMTLSQIFPEQAQKEKSPNKEITVRQLLHHRSGLEANLSWRSYSQKDSLRRQRLLVVQNALTANLQHAPGEKYLYSNLGYTLLGAIVEKVTGQSWEAAIKKKLFKPLKMNRVGFGGTGTRGKIDQPWPHREDGSPTPKNGPLTDNALVIAPAGCVHCTIVDWSRFIADLLCGIRGQKALLQPETYKQICTPPDGGEYGFGWIVARRKWAGGLALNHAGSNTMNCALAWIAPNKDFAVLLCTNQGGDKTFNALDEAVGKIIQIKEKSSQK